MKILENKNKLKSFSILLFSKFKTNICCRPGRQRVNKRDKNRSNSGQKVQFVNIYFKMTDFMGRNLFF